MDGFKPGDVVVTKRGLYWHGEDVGDRLGRVIDSKGHVLVNLYEYDDNPVKCFTYELDHIEDVPVEFRSDEIDDMLDDIDSIP